MPSAKETSFLIDVMPEPSGTNSYLARDVDALVSRIKENLRLSNSLKSRSSLHPTKTRVSPYKLPTTTTTTGPTTTAGVHPSGHEEYDDSHERLQALLRQGALIKEAVKRLRASDIDLLQDHATTTTTTTTVNQQQQQHRRRGAAFNSATSTDQDEDDDEYADSEETDEEDVMRACGRRTCRLFEGEQRRVVQQR